jgi:hypothetical protein
VAVLVHHAAWYRAFPQYTAYPPDQAGYLAGGQAIFAAVSSLVRDGYQASTMVELRRWFDFLGVALFYGVLDGLKPNDLFFARGVLAFFNALTAVGVYAVARRLGSPGAGVIALLLFLASPAFPSGASRLYPDALTGCLIVWAVRLFIPRRGGSALEGGRFAILAGVLAGTAMLVRVQMLPWVPLGLAGCSVLALLMRVGPQPRSLMRFGWLGLSLPLMIFVGATGFGLENRNDSAPKHNLPRYHYYAYGFWQYVESDGWEGPWRLKKDPYYEAMVEAEKSEPGLLASRPRQYLFALRYLNGRLDKAIPVVLGNFYRIFDRPQNPEHRGFIPPRMATWIHRLALLSAVVASAHLYATSSPGFIAPLLILSLGCFHALAWGWPRYLMPVLPVVLALGGVGLEIVGRSLRTRARWWGRAVLIVVGLLGLGALLRNGMPEFAWWLGTAALLLAVVQFIRLPFADDSLGAARWPSFLFAACVSAVGFGNAWRDGNWHQVDLDLRAGDTVRQEIRVAPEALVGLRAARDRFVAVDLELRSPSERPFSVKVNGIAATLTPSIPPLPESIPVLEESRGYPQWWVLPLTDAMIDEASRVGVVIVDIAIDRPRAARLKGDRFKEQATRFEAPALGDWPWAAGIKPEYDRDFRLVRRLELSSLQSKTSLVRDGATQELSEVARVRVMELEDREGSVSFEAARPASIPGPKGATTDAVLAFAGRAIMKNRGEAALLVSGQQLIRFPIAPFQDEVWSEGPYRLCYRDRTPDRDQGYESRGLYLLAGPLPCAGGTCAVEARFWPWMDDRPMSFSTETAKSQPKLEVLTAVARECGFDAPVSWSFGRLTDGTRNSYPQDRGRWRVPRIY